MPLGFNLFPSIIARMHHAAHEIVNETCTDVQTSAQQFAAVDTSFMQQNIYVLTSDINTYDTGGISPPGDSELLDQLPPPPNDTTGYIASGASYSIDQEFGTAHQSGTPFMIPAAEANRATFITRMRDMESRMGA